MFIFSSPIRSEAPPSIYYADANDCFSRLRRAERVPYISFPPTSLDKCVQRYSSNLLKHRNLSSEHNILLTHS
jgi:hypothetical protein